jgi:hypothetical protein
VQVGRASLRAGLQTIIGVTSFPFDVSNDDHVLLFFLLLGRNLHHGLPFPCSWSAPRNDADRPFISPVRIEGSRPQKPKGKRGFRSISVPRQSMPRLFVSPALAPSSRRFVTTAFASTAKRRTSAPAPSSSRLAQEGIRTRHAISEMFPSYKRTVGTTKSTVAPHRTACSAVARPSEYSRFRRRLLSQSSAASPSGRIRSIVDRRCFCVSLV